jgi:hypothetical protein
MQEEDVDFSDDFCRFLQTTIPAVEAAELLLVFLRDPTRAWTVEELRRALGPGVDDVQAARYLQGFEGQLVARTESDMHRYQPATPELDGHVRKLERVYRERPVTLIRVIYGLRDSGIRHFADAFRLRRK